MKHNIGSAERIIRFVAAASVGFLYFTDVISDTLALVLGIGAVVFLLTSFVEFCPLYAPFRISTKKRENFV
jgi:hypothetical protein